MLRPDPSKHNPDPDYIRSLVGKSGLSQRGAAKAVGISERMMRHYLAGTGKCPYTVQFALECLPDNSPH